MNVTMMLDEATDSGAWMRLGPIAPSPIHRYCDARYIQQVNSLGRSFETSVALIPPWAWSVGRVPESQCTHCGIKRPVRGGHRRVGDLGSFTNCGCTIPRSWWYVLSHKQWCAVRRYLNAANPWKHDQPHPIDAVTSYTIPTDEFVARIHPAYPS